MNTLQLQEFFVEGGDHKTSHALLHIAEPSTPEEKKKGYFFAVCEINQSEDRDIVALQNLIDEIENRYYETPEKAGVNCLEEVLTKINHESYTLSTKKLDLNCAVGVLKKEEVFFSCHGEPLMFLFYRNKNGIYQKMNLVDSSEENPESAQLFKQIVQGKISPNDFLFVATPHVADYFNPDRLEKIISIRPVRQSAEHLERVLSELKNKMSFGGLIIHLHEEAGEIAKVKKTSPIVKGSSEKSLHSLFATEQNTASTLSSALIPNIGNKLKTLLNQEKNEDVPEITTSEEIVPTNAEISSNHARQHRPSPTTNTETPTDWVEITKKIIAVIIEVVKRLALAIWWILVFVFKVLYSIARFIALLFLVITNIKNRRANILDSWQRQLKEVKNTIWRLPLITKILLIATVMVIAIFILSITFIQSHRANAAAEQQFNSTLQQITAAKDAAESALIYKNEAGALTELQTAKNYLASLNCKNKKDICDELNTQLETLLIKIRKITVISPETLIDWTEYPGAINKIIKIKNKIIALSPDNGEVLVYNLLTKEKSLLKIGSQLKTLAIPKENDYALVLAENNTFWRFNPDDNTIKKIDITFPQKTVGITNMVIYNRRLYTLDSLNGQIYKHENNKDSFGLGNEWVKDVTNNLKDGVDLAIDGDIFVTHQSGNITKLTKGEFQTFAVSGLDPTLTNGTEIWTYNDTEQICLLDNVGKRFIILNKSGQLQTQIATNIWENPSSFTVGDNNKQFYVLDKNKVYSVLLL